MRVLSLIVVVVAALTATVFAAPVPQPQDGYVVDGAHTFADLTPAFHILVVAEAASSVIDIGLRHQMDIV